MLFLIREIIILQLIIFFSYSICFGQPGKSFVVVHCDPNEAHNFPNLEVLVDSANAYNIKLTIEFTAPWIDSILPYQARLNKIIIWQADGHEIGLHHHEITAPGIWDGYSNFSMAEINNEGRDTNLFIGNTDSLYNLAQKVTQQPIKTVGVEDSTSLPTQALYQTRGHDISHGYSNAFSFTYNNLQYCRTSHCIVDAVFKTQQLIAQYPTMTGKDIIGVNTHVHNFVDDPMALISYFQFVNINGGILSQTVSGILGNCFPVGDKSTIDPVAIESWPNPFLNSINIKLPYEKNRKSELLIFNTEGEHILSIDQPGQNICINTEKWANGVYYLNVNTDNKSVYSKKIIKF